MLYTTGEIAKLCDVSVRTVQYYDNRGILTPSDLTEGGRRLYSDDDLRRMKVICFLRDLGFSINNISTLLSDSEQSKVIELLICQQKECLQSEISASKSKLNTLEELEKELRISRDFSLESIGDIAHIMENKKKLRKVRAVILTVGILMDIIEIGTILLWIFSGIWWPFVVGMIGVVTTGILISLYYVRSVSYICPHCHTVFNPKFKEMFWASHTPRTRKLRCPNCSKKSFCVETARDK